VVARARHGVRVIRPCSRYCALDLDLGSYVMLGPTFGGDSVLSPDGKRLAYTTPAHGFSLDGLIRPMPVETYRHGRKRVYAPFFSPDGQWGRVLHRVGLEENRDQWRRVRLLCVMLPGAWGGQLGWVAMGDIIAAIAGRLSRISSSGGAPVRLAETGPPGEVQSPLARQILPGGKAVLFTAYNRNQQSRRGKYRDFVPGPIGVASRFTREVPLGRYLPSGHLVYLNGGYALRPREFDLWSGWEECAASPTPVLGDVMELRWTGACEFGLFPAAIEGPGMLIYRSGPASPPVTVHLIDGEGSVAATAG